MIKHYEVYRALPKMVRANNLTKAESRYITSSDNIYYDFSLLDEIKFNEDWEREAIERDLMEHHSISWYEQPMPTIILWNDYTEILGQIKTAYRRVYRASGKRMMVIVEVTKLRLEKLKRHSIYDRTFEPEVLYEADNHHSQCDVDIEVA